MVDQDITRRDDEDEEPMNKDDYKKMKEKLANDKKQLNEKDRLLSITQKYYIGYGNNHQVVKNVMK